mgnify:CR=1 FL=1
MTNLRLIRMHPKHDECWTLMPHLERRLTEWAIRFGQGHVEGFTGKVKAAFVLGLDTVATWVMVNAEGQIVGHLVAIEDDYSGRKVGFVVQLAADVRVPETIQADAQFELDAWARGKGFKEILMLTRRANMRAWRRWGFTLYRFLLRKDLSADG